LSGGLWVGHIVEDDEDTPPPRLATIPTFESAQACHAGLAWTTKRFHEGTQDWLNLGACPHAGEQLTVPEVL